MQCNGRNGRRRSGGRGRGAGAGATTTIRWSLLGWRPLPLFPPSLPLLQPSLFSALRKVSRSVKSVVRSVISDEHRRLRRCADPFIPFSQKMSPSATKISLVAAIVAGKSQEYTHATAAEKRIFVHLILLESFESGLCSIANWFESKFESRFESKIFRRSKFYYF